MGLINYFVYFRSNFEPETSANHPKYLKTRSFSSFNKIFSEIQPSNGLGPGPD